MNGGQLTNREQEITELYAWGSAKKEIAERLCISERTVENHLRHVYEKVGCTKATELSAWWFCNKFKISFNLSPIARKSVAILLLCLHLTGEYVQVNDILYLRTRVRNRTSITTLQSKLSRRNTYKLAV